MSLTWSAVPAKLRTELRTKLRTKLKTMAARSAGPRKHRKGFV